jgi:hypothetical protein
VSDGKSSGTFTCARFTKSLGNEALFQSHPDHDLFGSLPGAKKMLAPRLLGAIGSDPGRYTSFQVLQSFAGTAPISFERGVEHGFRSCAHGGGRRMSRAEAARKVTRKAYVESLANVVCAHSDLLLDEAPEAYKISAP